MYGSCRSFTPWPCLPLKTHIMKRSLICHAFLWQISLIGVWPVMPFKTHIMNRDLTCPLCEILYIRAWENTSWPRPATMFAVQIQTGAQGPFLSNAKNRDSWQHFWKDWKVAFSKNKSRVSVRKYDTDNHFFSSFDSSRSGFLTKYHDHEKCRIFFCLDPWFFFVFVRNDADIKIKLPR